MKISRLVISSFLLSFLLLSVQSGYAQSQDPIKQALNDALKTYLVNQKPFKGCEHDNCAHNYAGSIKITKRVKAGSKLQVTGMAKVKYKGPFDHGEGVVTFFAQLVKRNGQPEVELLKWQKSRCMKMETLLDRRAG
ncbi:MAG: hypothetical protein AAGI38_15610 [Bacteroidota bacterium]